MHLLLLKTSSLGDLLHSFPALTDAQAAIADFKVTWVVEESLQSVPHWHGAVTQVIPVALRRWRKHPWAAWRQQQWSAFRQQIRQQHFDAIIDAQGLLKSAVLLLGLRQSVIGYDWHSAREPLASLFYRRRIVVNVQQHAVERTRSLFAAALGYTVPQQMGQYGLQWQHNRQQCQPAVLLLHGTTWATKHWPEAYWYQLAQQINALGLSVWLTWGNAVEQARAQRIAAHCQQSRIIPYQPLPSLIPQLLQAQAAVAVDTGLAHICAALSIPTVTLYGPTSAVRSGAYGQGQINLHSNWHCAPCLKRCCQLPAAQQRRGEQPPCFQAVTPDRVLAALQSALVIESETRIHTHNRANGSGVINNTSAITG